MVAGKDQFLVLIDKKEQRRRMDKKGSIFLSPQYTFMKYFLQQGIVASIGRHMRDMWPEIEEGDTLIFHHKIENGPDRLIEVLPNKDEIRYVNGTNAGMNYEVQGVIKKNTGTLIPAPQFLFVTPTVSKMRQPPIESDLVAVDPEGWDDEDRILMMIEDRQAEIGALKENFDTFRGQRRRLSDEEMKRVEMIAKMIGKLEEELAELGKELNDRSLITTTVLHLHEKTYHEIGILPGNRVVVSNRVLYPLRVVVEGEEQQFLLVNKDYLDAVLN